MSEREPTPQEVTQSEVADIPAVPVRVEGPVDVRQLPAVMSADFSRTITSTAEKLLSSDDRRKRAVIIAVDLPIYIGASANGVQSGNAFLLPTQVPYEITHTDEIWAGVAQASAQSIVSVLSELWTE